MEIDGIRRVGHQNSRKESKWHHSFAYPLSGLIKHISLDVRYPSISFTIFDFNNLLKELFRM